MTSKILRAGGIILGIAAAVSLAVESSYFPVEQNVAPAISGLRALLDLIVWPFDTFLAAPFAEWTRGQGVAFELLPYWKSAFILLWLLYGTTAMSFTDADARWAAFIWAFSGVAALATILNVGWIPLSDPSVFIFAVNGWSAFYVVVLLLVWFFQRESQSWFFAYFLIIGAVGSVRYLLWSAREMPIIAEQPSPVLAMLAVTFAALGLTHVVLGAFLQDGDGDTFVEQWWRSGLTRAGLNILSVLVGAGAIIYALQRLAV